LLAAFSPMLAVVLLAVSLGVRAILRRQWLHLIDILDADVAGQREVYYLSELAVTGAPHDVRLFGLAGWLTGRFRATAHRVYAASWREMWQVLRRQWLILTLVTGSAALALATPAAAALAGRLTTGQLITSVLAAWGVLSISAMGHEAYDIEYGMRGAQAAADLERAYTRDRALAADGGAPLPLVCAGPPLIVLEDVGFTYPGAEHATLDGLSLTLHPGETVAVVGGNGAGKTTLVKLLSGLYLPQAGRMTIDGTDVTALDRAAWQACVAAVFQDFVRYPLSLRENVAPVAAGDAAVREALHRAGGGDLLDGSAFGLDTLLWREGAGGTDLSGGQWQRVALARALHAVGGGRRLLLLDEPTAHLDVEAEAEFHGRVVRQVSGATTVLVSHRLSTVRPADRIVLMHDGRIAESGTHPELLALNGRYARFYELQTQAFAATGHRTAGRSE
jgi:ATP-binding cassette subfamily B protein